jgi:hypothetical protein
MFRLVTRRQSAAPSSQMHSRVEVCPPELWPSSLSWRGRFRRLTGRLLNRVAPWLPETAQPINRLALVKTEFQEIMSDLDDPLSEVLLDQIERARSLRELWHLRSPVFSALALANSQSEAERRLARLNRHFPVRAPRANPTPMRS